MTVLPVVGIPLAVALTVVGHGFGACGSDVLHVVRRPALLGHVSDRDAQQEAER